MSILIKVSAKHLSGAHLVTRRLMDEHYFSDCA